MVFIDAKTFSNLFLYQEAIARLVNTFASLTVGRNYLCQENDILVNMLLQLIFETHPSHVKLDVKTRDHLLATLQKLSLRKKIRLKMIDAGQNFFSSKMLF